MQSHVPPTASHYDKLFRHLAEPPSEVLAGYPALTDYRPGNTNLTEAALVELKLPPISLVSYYFGEDQPPSRLRLNRELFLPRLDYDQPLCRFFQVMQPWQRRKSALLAFRMLFPAVFSFGSPFDGWFLRVIEAVEGKADSRSPATRSQVRGIIRSIHSINPATRVADDDFPGVEWLVSWANSLKNSLQVRPAARAVLYLFFWAAAVLMPLRRPRLGIGRPAFFFPVDESVSRDEKQMQWMDVLIAAWRVRVAALLAVHGAFDAELEPQRPYTPKETIQ